MWNSDALAIGVSVVLIYVVTAAINGWVRPPRLNYRGEHQTIKVNRLPFRFSLRTMLIAMTLAAVVLGLIVFLTQKPAAPPLDVGDFPHRVN